MSARSEKKLVLDVVRGELIVQVRSLRIEAEVIFGAAVEIDRELAGTELGQQRDRIVRIPERLVGTEQAAHPRADRLGAGAPRRDVAADPRVRGVVWMR